MEINRIKICNYLIGKEKQMLLAAFLFAFLLRGLYVIYKYNTTGTTEWSDDWEYLSMGRQIADGNWTPKLDVNRYMQVGPILPLLIAIGIKIFGNPILFVFVYNIVITSLVVPLLFYLGKEIFNRKVGWLLAAWGIFYIDFFKYNPNLLKEPTVFFFFPLTIFLLIKTIRNNSPWINIIMSSISFAWLIHSDERYIFYFPVFIMLFFLKGSLKLHQSIRFAAIWTGLVLLLMLPWVIHNNKLFNQVVIISPRTTAFTSKVFGKDISNLSITNNNQSSSFYNERLKFRTDLVEKKYGITSREYKGFELYARAFLNFWQPSYFKGTFIQYGARFQKWSLIHNVSSILFYGIFIPFYLFGILLLTREKYTFGLFIASISIIHSIIHTYMLWPLERYRSPIIFIVVMIGFWGLTELYAKTSVKLIII
jgi:hypothetical protein